MTDINVCWTISDVGCYFDGARGHRALRDALADLIEGDEDMQPVVLSLQGDMPDDAWDENEALDFLNSQCNDAVTWVFDEGNLILLPVKDAGEL